MFEFKLQVGCMAVVLYILIIYVKETLHGKLKCKRIFDAVLAISPWAIFFDGATAWTVNHLDTVPDWVNMVLHWAFFVSMDTLVVLLAIYVLQETLSVEKKIYWLAAVPGIITIILTTVLMPKVYYVVGVTTNYSMGWPVYVSYGSLVIHLIAILTVVLKRIRYIEKHKLFNVLAFMGSSLIALCIQMFYPEILITCLFPTFAVVGIYLNAEDPAFRKLQSYNDEMVMGFATLVESRDDSTGGHIRRTSGYVGILLRQMAKSSKYRNLMTRDYINNIIKAAPMHDLGKISTPDEILQKPGKLTDEEFDIMKQHSAVGGDIILRTFAELDDEAFKKVAYEVARYHHEKWNGKGYPEGISGEDIPLHARVMAIADVFDAVSADRCYRPALPLDKCFEIIEEGAGKDFDPDLAQLFLGAKDEVISYLKNN